MRRTIYITCPHCKHSHEAVLSLKGRGTYTPDKQKAPDGEQLKAQIRKPNKNKKLNRTRDKYLEEWPNGSWGWEYYWDED